MKDADGQNHYAVEPFAPDDGLSDRSGEELLHECCRELGVNMATAVQIVAWADERVAPGGDCSQGKDAITAARDVNARHRLAYHVLISYQANQKTYEEVCAAQRVMALVLRFKTAAGADNIADLARKTGISKQTLNKMRVIFREKLGLPPEDAERSETARANMTEARFEQLAPITVKSAIKKMLK